MLMLSQLGALRSIIILLTQPNITYKHNFFLYHSLISQVTKITPLSLPFNLTNNTHLPIWPHNYVIVASVLVPFLQPLWPVGERSILKKAQTQIIK